MLQRFSIPCFFLSLLLLFANSTTCQAASSKTFVTADIFDQLGNNLFQIATASALAWDHNTEAYFPDLTTNQNDNIPINREHVLFKCKTNPPKSKNIFSWIEPTFSYNKIPFHPAYNHVKLHGFFQSEKYFVKHRKKILTLFTLNEVDSSYLETKYKNLLSLPNTVGIQIRFYREDPTGGTHIQHGSDYYSKAIGQFPSDSVFVVSSNNREFAKSVIPDYLPNVIYLDDPYYIEMFVLSKCKHNIIGNSSFGWWAAWLNQNPEKIVFAPRPWLNPACGTPTQDVVPESWILLDAAWGASGDFKKNNE